MFLPLRCIVLRPCVSSASVYAQSTSRKRPTPNTLRRVNILLIIKPLDYEFPTRAQYAANNNFKNSNGPMIKLTPAPIIIELLFLPPDTTSSHLPTHNKSIESIICFPPIDLRSQVRFAFKFSAVAIFSAVPPLFTSHPKHAFVARKKFFHVGNATSRKWSSRFATSDSPRFTSFHLSNHRPYASTDRNYEF